jgi:hypothetical protein
MSVMAEATSQSRVCQDTRPLPTAPCSVVWSGGHAYVLEGSHGRARWVGVDDRGRPRFFTGDELQLRGWSRTR